MTLLARTNSESGPMLRIVARAALVWLLIVALAIANGIFREMVLVPQFGHGQALSLSGILLALLILGLTWLLLPWIGQLQARHYRLIGAGWLALTIAFEFGFGLAAGKTLSELFVAYDFRGGNLWLLVLAMTAAAPWLASKMPSIRICKGYD